MFTPKFQTLLKKESFHPNKVVCLGSQMILIVDFLQDILVPHTWYGADVDAFEKKKKKFGLDSCFLKIIGSDLSLIEICSKIDQFLSGVFFAIENDCLNQNLEKIKINTEDEQFRELNINGILVEIRAFDTSFFEVYTTNKTLIKKISKKFNSSYHTKVSLRKSF